MADPARFVTMAETRLRKLVENIIENDAILKDLIQRNEWLGGSAHYKPHFFTDEEMTIERDDLNFTYQQFNTVISNLVMITNLVDATKMAAIMKITG